MNGRTVKGINFTNMRDAGNIVELAARYSADGADELVFLDITASADRRATMPVWVERVAATIDIPFIVGGGVSCEKDVETLLLRGADKVSVNSAALDDPNLINRLVRNFGNERVVVAIDACQEEGVWRVYSKGGQTRTDRELFEWAAEVEARGGGEILFTSMDHDGTNRGFACDALARLSETVGIPVIASGGAGALSDFYDAFALGHAAAALAAGIFHDGHTTIREVKEYLINKGVEISWT